MTDNRLLIHTIFHTFMNANHTAPHTGPCQLNENLNPSTSWSVFDASVVADSPLGVIEAPTGDLAIGLARERWPDKADDVAVVATDTITRERAKLERLAKSDLKLVANHQAALAVVSHHFGYKIESITTHPRFCDFDRAGHSCGVRLGYTRLSGVPSVEELMGPRRRLEAEKYMISVLSAQVGEFHAGRKTPQWSGAGGIDSINTLLEFHSEDCFDAYVNWLNARTAMLLAGSPVADEFRKIAALLIRRREIIGDEFRESLTGHAGIDHPQSESILHAEPILVSPFDKITTTRSNQIPQPLPGKTTSRQPPTKTARSHSRAETHPKKISIDTRAFAQSHRTSYFIEQVVFD